MNLPFMSQHTVNYSCAVRFLRDKQVLAPRAPGCSTCGCAMSEVKMGREEKVWRCPSHKTKISIPE